MEADKLKRAIAVAALLSLGFSKSGTVYTTDGSQADVMAAIADSKSAGDSGDTVNVPAGTFSWGTGFVAVNLNANVILNGAGQGVTIIQMVSGGPSGVYGTIQMTTAGVAQNFTILAPSTASYPGVDQIVPFAASGTSGWRITNVTCDMTDGGVATDCAYFCYVGGSLGIADHCTITGGGGTDELFFCRGPLNGWQQADSFGSQNAIYIENCTFNGQGYVSDFNSNSRGVVRYCTITSANFKVDAHGMDSNSPARSFRAIEVYRNTWTSSGGGAMIEIRGGSGFLFDNQETNSTASTGWMILDSYGPIGPWPNYGASITAVSTTGNPTSFTTAQPHLLTTGWNPLAITWNNGGTVLINSTSEGPVTVTGSTTFTLPINFTTTGGTGGNQTEQQTPYNYPLHDQIGVGVDAGGVYSGGAASDPIYVWNNLAAASGGAGSATVPWTTTWKTNPSDSLALYVTQGGPSSFGQNAILQTDRDWFTDLTVTYNISTANPPVWSAKGGSPTFDGSTGVGRGTTAQMNAITPSKTGVGFWVTDQGNWNQSGDGRGSGELYVWNGSAWVLKYVPYTYPFFRSAHTATAGVLKMP